MDDDTDDALQAGHDHLNDLPVDKGIPPCPDVVMNPLCASTEILNSIFTVNQGPEQVNQV